MLFRDADPDMTPDFTWACQWTGLVDERLAAALAQVVAPRWHAQKPANDLAEAALAVPEFENALTERGRISPNGAALRLVLNAGTEWMRRYHRTRAAGRKWDDAAQRLVTASGPHTCLHAWALDGETFPAAAAPPLPLPGCDAGHCACSYSYTRLGWERSRKKRAKGADG